MKTEKAETECYLFAPMMEKFFKDKRKNDTLVWIPVQCSLLFSEEFQNIAPVNRCIFVSFMLLCGMRGSFEIPFKINYLANTLGINKRAISKGIEELIGANLLHKRERKKEEKEKTAQHRQTETHGECADAENAAVVCVSSENFSKTESENQFENNLLKGNFKGNSSDAAKRSQFSLEECLKYVEVCLSKGEAVKNAKGLANHLFKTGEADAFIRHALYPEKQTEIDRQIYGEPRRFSDAPCSICFGAKMADADGKGYRKCEHCRNERGKPTGLEPI